MLCARWIRGVRGLAARDPATLAQGKFRNLSKGRGSAGSFRPECHGVETVGGLAREQNDSASRPIDHLTLQRKPRASDVGDIAEVRQPFPERRFEGGDRRTRRRVVRAGIILARVGIRQFGRRARRCRSADRPPTSWSAGHADLPFDVERAVPRFILAQHAAQHRPKPLGRVRGQNDAVRGLDGYLAGSRDIPSLVCAKEQVDLFARTLNVDHVGEVRRHILVDPLDRRRTDGI